MAKEYNKQPSPFQGPPKFTQIGIFPFDNLATLAAPPNGSGPVHQFLKSAARCLCLNLGTQSSKRFFGRKEKERLCQEISEVSAGVTAG
jgi:hypothetical protein